MLNELKKQMNRSAKTENRAVTLMSTQSHCLDLFATIGALRNASEDDIITRFMLAYAENPDLAMKILFYARDIRGGIGERDTFRFALRALANTNPSSVIKNISYIAEFGRYDDLLALLDTPCEAEALSFLKRKFDADMISLQNGKGVVSLLGKWLPSVNASNAKTVANAKKIAKAFGLRDVEYRKALSALRARIRIIENNLRERDYTFDYEQQPSRALLKYRAAFERNDNRRYREYQLRVQNGKARMHTAGLAPYDIVKPILRRKAIEESERHALDLAWENLPDFKGDGDTLVVVDGSASMYWGNEPIATAISLGIYMAEHMDGKFKNHFITFSSKPRLVEIRGKDICEKVRYCMRFNEVANTDIEKVIRLILDTALDNQMTQEDMVKRIIIVSDMEFDRCAENASLTNFENAKMLFEMAGYKLPQIVFWNVASKNHHHPVSMNEQGVALVSGCSPRLFSNVAKDGAPEELSPYNLMLEIIGTERYSMISA